jgi:selenocysteine-specific elongation factor
MRHCAVAVVGHVDHGKTALVRALTGIETDRLKEEQARGLSIVLGFAHRDYPSGAVEFIDAPGHENFIRTAVSGASGVRSVLLVVSAVDGFARQTREHLQIASLLGVATGVVAVTKSDLLSDDLRDQREAEIQRDLADTALAGEPIVFCSARTGFGLDRLNEALDGLLGRSPPAPALPGFFLPTDRVFNLHGVGTVATGTLLGGALETGAEAVIEASGRRVTVRGLQARGAAVDRVEAGWRAAVQLRGASLDHLRPGDVICEPGRFCASSQVDGLVTVSPGVRPLKHLESVRFLVGTRSVVASVRLLDGKSIEADGQGLVQFRFPAPVPTYARQRAILRRLSPAETIGGAIVLDPAATPSARRSAERIAVLQAALGREPMDVVSALAARDRGVVSRADAARLLGLRPEDPIPGLGSDFEHVGDDLIASRRWLDDGRLAYLDALAEVHRRSPSRPAAPVEVIRRALAGAFAGALVEHVERRLAEAGDILAARGRVALATHDPLAALSEAQRAELGQIEALLHQGGASPPDPDEIRRRDGGGDLLDLLIDLGRAVALRNYALRKTVVFHAQALEAAFRALAATFPPPAQFKTGEAREALATSRKFIVPLLECFDERGWTRRDGDTRQISGPSPE